MLLRKGEVMKTDKLQKKILIILLLLCLITPIGILLPMLFNAGDAWGEWSAQTLKDLIGYVPQGLAKYSDVWNAPLPDYTMNSSDNSVVTYVVMFLISRLIVRNEK
jgi:ABC-type spermidine/putrescine transport system permease subunit II